jgi:hypothetical protein
MSGAGPPFLWRQFIGSSLAALQSTTPTKRYGCWILLPLSLLPDPLDHIEGRGIGIGFWLA